jgi:uncharacterized protein (TIGR02145 family)
MSDGRVWMAQNLNYTKDLTANAASNIANGKTFTSSTNGVPSIGSYWCPGANGKKPSGDSSICNTYGALYSWETAMMVDGKWAEAGSSSTVWVESWVSGNAFTTGASSTTANADKNNARGSTDMKGGGRGICPESWYVPTDKEWAVMLDAIDNTTIYLTQIQGGDTHTTEQGRKIKSTDAYTGTDPADGSWYLYSNTRGTNTTGFTAVPCGYRDHDGGAFIQRGIYAMYHSSSCYDASNSWNRIIMTWSAGIERQANRKGLAIGVRCIWN